jgi:hypothetical protein|tara:strand:+ start:1386 stop:1496 length:111 start_codon:yes stop_codon:yes gene_type:complete
MYHKKLVKPMKKKTPGKLKKPTTKTKPPKKTTKKTY